ncbi:HD domain-containing protein [Candidatus Dojkabacteria bacterium]|nr:HD domain-containing protein [Candidatus Dojkabacteria bacterium]
MKNKVNILQNLNNLKHIKRTGPNLFAGISSGELESIAEHTFMVSSIVMLFAEEAGEVDLGNMLQYALVHDWGESIIGDMPSGSRSYREYFEGDIRQIHKKAEHKAKETLLQDGSIELPDLSTLEKELLQLADTISIILELIDLKQKGHGHKWVRQMFDVQIKKLKDFSFNFIAPITKELENMFIEGMSNKYLTKASLK